MHRYSFPSTGSDDLISWEELPLQTVATLLATDLKHGLSHHEAAARLHIVHRRLSGSQRFRLMVCAALRVGSTNRTVHVMRDGQVSRIARERVVPGDVIELSQGEQVPARARLIENKELIWKENQPPYMIRKHPKSTSCLLLCQGSIILSDVVFLVAIAPSIE